MRERKQDILYYVHKCCQGQKQKYINNTHLKQKQWAPWEILTKGGMIPRYWGKPGPTGGWPRGKAGLPAGGFLGGPWDWGFGGGAPAAPSITKFPPGPPSTDPSPGRVGASPRPPPSRQLVASEDSRKRGKRRVDERGAGWGQRFAHGHQPD